MKKIIVELNMEELDPFVVNVLDSLVRDIDCINSWEEYEEPVF